MDIKVDEISKILRAQIEGYDRQTDLAEVGTIIAVGDGIGRIYGLEKCMAGELLAGPTVATIFASFFTGRMYALGGRGSSRAQDLRDFFRSSYARLQA